eukprot:199001-Alexandrium_andersonii.AAC.1
MKGLRHCFAVAVAVAHRHHRRTWQRAFAWPPMPWQVHSPRCFRILALRRPRIARSSDPAIRISSAISDLAIQSRSFG